MRHDRNVPTPADHFESATAAAAAQLREGGRYLLHERQARPLRIAGTDLLPVGPLRMYCCGITPYDVTHVGHASTFVWADLIGSLAHATGSHAVVARNVTDVDDVLTAAARTRGRHFDELAATQEFLFNRDMTALSVAPPTMTPHARTHVAAVIRLATALLDAGAAYERDGFVYFRGEAVPGRAGLDEETALAASHRYGDQHDVPDRESLFDVPVWRPSPEDDPAWPSPWGWGRPGWHAECSAMAVASLGNSVDILLGGSDLAFPHHAYQAAMVEAASRVTPFARAVVHVGEVRLEDAKMAKSTKNLVLVSDLLERYTGRQIRFTLLHRRWDAAWECSDAEFERGAAVLDQLTAAAAGGSDGPEDAADLVLSRLLTELDVPGAVEVALREGGAAARYLRDILKVA
jgi:cysteinyl-tRNA synthetase